MNRVSVRGSTALLVVCLSLLGAQRSPAQEPSETKPRSPDYAGMENSGFRLGPWDVLEHTRQLSFRDPSKLNDRERFMLDYYSKNWEAVAQRMREMPGNLAEKVYGKILKELNADEKPLLALDDAVAIMDLCPSDLSKNADRIGQIASLIKGVSRPWEAPLLGARLEKGTRIAGGKDPQTRLLAGRILMRTDFVDLAKTFLPNAADAAAMPEGPVRDEVLKFLGVQQARQETLEAEAKLSPGENLQALVESSRDPHRWQEALNGFRERLKTLPTPVVMAVVKQILAKDGVAGQELIQVVLQRMAWEGRTRNADDRQADYLQLQIEMADLLAALPGVPEARRKLLLNGMAENWIQQAEITLREKPEYDKRRADPNAKPRFVDPEILIATAPRGGIWSSAMPPLQEERVALLVPRLQLCGDEPDKALPTILDLAKRSPPSAGLLAQEFVCRWADMHDPRISEPIRKRYQLAAGTAIVVTPIMVRKNVEGLAAMMDLLRRNNIVPHDYKQVFGAFDFCYGNADVYQIDDIEKVFGPVGDMPEELFNVLLDTMEENLGSRWRIMATQQAALYNRGQDQLLAMIRRGYADALKMLDARVARHPDAWRALTAGGTLLSDWGDLEYFQELTKAPAPERIRLYREKNLLAQDYFLKGCQAYARGVPALDAKRYTAEAFLAWFQSLLGLNSNGEITLSKAMNREALTHIGEAIRGLPAHAAEAHMALFGKAIDARLAHTDKPIPPDMKFKYIASGLVVTADTASGASARKKLDYYDDLLSGVRLETRVDGSNTVWRKADFGIVVSLVHSEFMGRLLKVEKYVQAQPAPNNKGAVKRMGAETPARNDLERGILEALTPFFEVKSVTFSPRDVMPRSIGRPGWQETVLAYAQVRARDISVDRVPPIEMKLDYVDLDGPVQLPVASAETLMRLVEDKDKAPPLPCGNFRIAQTLDLRPADNGGLSKLTVAVEGSGLMPELEDIVDLAPLQACLPVKKVEPKEDTLVKDLQSWSDKVGVTSARQWALTLDSRPLREAQAAFTVAFPAQRDTNSVVRNEIFEDENLTPVTGGQVTIPAKAKAAGAGGAESSAAGGEGGPRPIVLWGGLGAAVLAVASVAAVWVVRSRKRGNRPPRIEEVFRVPAPIDGFVAVRCLRNLAASDLAHWRPEQKAELTAAISRIEQACFDPARSAIPEAELLKTAQHWLRQAL